MHTCISLRLCALCVWRFLRQPPSVICFRLLSSSPLLMWLTPLFTFFSSSFFPTRVPPSKEARNQSTRKKRLCTVQGSCENKGNQISVPARSCARFLLRIFARVLRMLHNKIARGPSCTCAANGQWPPRYCWPPSQQAMPGHAWSFALWDARRDRLRSRLLRPALSLDNRKFSTYYAPLNRHADINHLRIFSRYVCPVNIAVTAVNEPPQQITNSSEQRQKTFLFGPSLAYDLLFFCPLCFLTFIM